MLDEIQKFLRLTNVFNTIQFAYIYPNINNLLTQDDVQMPVAKIGDVQIGGGCRYIKSQSDFYFATGSFPTGYNPDGVAKIQQSPYINFQLRFSNGDGIENINMGLLHDPSKVEYILVPRLGPHPQLTMYLKNYDGVNQFSEQGFQANFNYSCVTYDFPNITLINDSVVDLYSPLLQLTVKGVQAVYGGVSKYSDIAAGASLQHMNNMLNTQKEYARNMDKLSNVDTSQLPQASIDIGKLERLQRHEGRLDAWDQFKQDVSENGVQKIRQHFLNIFSVAQAQLLKK